MTKKITKIATLLCILAFVVTLAFTLTACGGSKKYTYSSSDFVMTVNGEDENMGIEDSVTSMYDTMFKDSTIEVSDSKIVWKVKDQESTLDVEKDGDKYVLSGDYANQLKQAMTQMGGTGDAEVDICGAETDDGFDIVMTLTMKSAGNTVKEIITFSFKK